MGYLAAGSLKFLINSIKQRQWAFKSMGLGGMPSTHNTVTMTIATLVTLKMGLDSPVIAVVFGLVLIVAIDSMGLRKHIESHAMLLHRKLSHADDKIKIRQKIGHSPLEVLAGMILGILCGTVLFII